MQLNCTKHYAKLYQIGIKFYYVKNLNNNITVELLALQKAGIPLIFLALFTIKLTAAKGNYRLPNINWLYSKKIRYFKLKIINYQFYLWILILSGLPKLYHFLEIKKGYRN